MRITVGGVIVVGAIGAAGYFLMSSSSDTSVSLRLKDSVREVSSFFGLIHSAEPEKNVELKPTAVPSPSVVESPSPVAVASPSAAPSTPIVASTPVVEAEPTPSQRVLPLPAGDLKSSRVAPRLKRRRHRRKRIMKTGAVRPAASAPAAATAQPEPEHTEATVAAPPKAAQPSSGPDARALLGTYVALELKSGRKVMGILEEKNAKGYRLQIPGLGPFSYAADAVKSIQPAQ